MNRRESFGVGAALFVLLLVAVMVWSVSVYHECREANSVSYCLRLVMP